ncbi:RNA polymerase sigma-70 factor (ECF subfamily) [Streptomyces griseochromogenes]|uniref:RNA polymerase sigma-70 factor (ECF subfamily) n=1 Tax=Streptomyces griseochromogenes TaxID=68214 RepID=A0A1B1AUN7_9ACTN|nr:sigma-70 family RNA polymerase sigma factor [Streptomyces griseochromogenes]ANP50267.1 RNA polymerase subunit sigma-70 [Streptomyces griseochromogenes]MBP2048078.1 RNA polymerase sigma-70 factor (ECF subfamily) [Streptomyces griseochromogenes]
MDGVTADGARLAARFEADRPHLTAVAYRLLGSAAEAEDALQDAWLRVQQADIGEVENLTGWLTTVVTRVCLNQLRNRRNRREDPLDAHEPAAPLGGAAGDPAREALLADEVGVALLVVLDALAPAERVAFVLHDMFAVPFDEIAPLLEKTPAATRQLASRARRRVRGRTPAPAAAARRRRAVEAFLAATRGGDFTALFALLAPDVVLHADARVVPTPEPITVRGAEAVARGAMAAVARAEFTGLALLDGRIGLVMAPYGRIRLVLAFTFDDDARITGIEVVAEPEGLRGIEVSSPREP